MLLLHGEAVVRRRESRPPWFAPHGSPARLPLDDAALQSTATAVDRVMRVRIFSLRWRDFVKTAIKSAGTIRAKRSAGASPPETIQERKGR